MRRKSVGPAGAILWRSNKRQPILRNRYRANWRRVVFHHNVAHFVHPPNQIICKERLWFARDLLLKGFRPRQEKKMRIFDLVSMAHVLKNKLPQTARLKGLNVKKIADVCHLVPIRQSLVQFRFPTETDNNNLQLVRKNFILVHRDSEVEGQWSARGTKGGI